MFLIVNVDTNEQVVKKQYQDLDKAIEAMRAYTKTQLGKWVEATYPQSYAGFVCFDPPVGVAVRDMEQHERHK